jgi:hypothetical protein
MSKDENINYTEQRIKKIISSIESTHFNLMIGEDDFEDYPGFTKEWIKNKVIDLYYLMQAYLEMIGMNSYLNSFKNKLDPIISNETDILQTTQLHPEGESELKIIIYCKIFLDAFRQFDYQISKVEEAIKLTSILGNTAFIIKQLNLSINSESDIYNAVKWILGLYYPSSRLLNKASFIQQFKTYIPDILIPELKIAIEYKFIKHNKKTADDFIDEVRIDASNYDGDPRYENFIAVICLENASIATPESIKVAWENKHFPANWSLVIVTL